jgi:hypothetical protein
VQTLILTFLWALMLQWGMLFGVRHFYRAWPLRKQRMVALLLLPVMVAGLAGYIWFGPSACPAVDAHACVAASVTFALRMVAMLLVAGGLLWLIDRVRT